MRQTDHTWELLMDELHEMKADIKEIKNNHLAHIAAEIVTLKSQLDVIKGERKGISISWQVLVAILGSSGLVWGVILLLQTFKK